MRFDLEVPIGLPASGEDPLDWQGLSSPAPVPVGAPMRLQLADIDEDPDQPRKEFDSKALRELADTIIERGVRQPISVRAHPEQPGRWLLNFGARRLRASALAGKTDIPAFLDETADSYDQVIENEQRENLRPIELALFVGRRMGAGESPAEIARRLGKSRSYVTFASALIDAPNWLMALYRAGRCRGIRELYELRRLHEIHPARVSAWLQGRDFVSRGDVLALREELGIASVTNPSTAGAEAVGQSSVVKDGPLKQPGAPSCLAGSPTLAPGPQASEAQATAPEAGGRPLPINRTSPPKVRVQLVADFEGNPVRVWLDTAPETAGHVFVSPMLEAGGGSARSAVNIEVLQALRLVHHQAPDVNSSSSKPL